MQNLHLNTNGAVNNHSSSVKVVRKRNFLIFPIIILLIAVVGLSTFLVNGTLKNIACNNLGNTAWVTQNINCSATSTNSNSALPASSLALNPNDTSNTPIDNNLITQIVEKSMPSVVTIIGTPKGSSRNILNRNQSTQTIGSGFIVRSDGIIITNSHVVSDTTLTYNAVFNSDNSSVPIQSINRDPTNDIAILKINKTNLSTLNLGNSDNLKIGNLVVAIGSPLGEMSTVTSGIVSGLNRTVSPGSSNSVSGLSSRSFSGVIQTDAAINPGNSGGPLINANGDVIGINFATVEGASNISFALPINRLKSKLTEFQQTGKFAQPFLGIGFTQQSFFDGSNIVSGALITQVVSNSPAEKAGLQVNDLITKVNDQNLTDTSLETIIQSSKVGDTLNLTVIRNNQTINITASVGNQ